MSLFAPAERQKAKARLAITGVTGAGKTLGALWLAYGMTGDWSKIALIDTEHERARFYAEREDLEIGQFLYAPLYAPYSAERYRQYVAEAAKEVGSDGVVIIDSFSHAWNQEDGVLDYKEKIAGQPGKNSYTAWNEAGRVQNGLVNFILGADCHTIVTMRSKMEYEVIENERGKKEPRRIGLAPIQRDDTEYEFDIVFDVGRDHYARTTKDTTFLDDFCAPLSISLGADINKWLNNAKDAPKRELCHECGTIITASPNKTAIEIVEGTRKSAGKQMCLKCFNDWRKSQVKDNADTAPVSE
ncbi:hypothetical protein FACS189490_13900 [Clostridia bacterium]|nr:hypothetical protein FACS189490_13900 [Clostridia bacterium]